MRGRRARPSRVSRMFLRMNASRSVVRSVKSFARADSRTEPNRIEPSRRRRRGKISRRRDHLFPAITSSSLARLRVARRHRATFTRLSRTCASNGFAPARADGAFTVGSGAGISNGFDIRHPRATARVAPAASLRASAPRIFPARPPSQLARRSRPSTRRRVRMKAFEWIGMQ